MTDRPPHRARRAAYLASLILFATVWLTFGFGLIDFASGFATGGNPRGTQVLSAAYGAVAGILLPAAFLAQLTAATREAGFKQAALVAVAFALAGVLGLDPLPLLSIAMLAIMLWVLTRLDPGPLVLSIRRTDFSRLGATFSVIAAGPAVGYLLIMTANQRAGLDPVEQAGRAQAGGWTGAALLAITVLLLSAFGAVRRDGWRVPIWSAAAATVVFGLVSTLNLEAPGSIGLSWAVAAMAWGVLSVTVSELGARRPRRA